MNRTRRVLLTILPFVLLAEYTTLAACYWWWPFGDPTRIIPLTPRIRTGRPQ